MPTDGNDTINANATNDKRQIHIYAENGDDVINMGFNTISKFAHGHHVRGGRRDGAGTDEGSAGNGRDTFNFVNIGRVNDTIVGRIEDFDASRDRIQIEGATLNLQSLPSNVRIVEFNGDHNDAGSDPQQWLLIDTNGGHIFYSLEGARVDMTGNGGANGGEQESHFIKFSSQIPNFNTLKDVDFIDPVNYVPAGYTPGTNGVIINDTDFDRTDVQEVIQGTGADDLIAAGLNDDVVRAGSGDDRVWGGSGHDKLYGRNGDDVLEGGNGNDYLYGGYDNDTMRGGQGADYLSGGDGIDVLEGNQGNDRLYGGNDNDKIYGGSGVDKLYGQNGNDILEGGSGNDYLYGGDGNDTMRGGEGADYLSGQDGADTMGGKEGDDRLYGGNDNDRLFGDNGNDKLYGENGNDILSGGNGNDKLYGHDQDDTLYGGNNNDYLSGGSGDDVLYGGNGSDTLYGSSGEDIVRGGAGNDRLIGGSGKDIMRGESGVDRFDFRSGDLLDWDALSGTRDQRERQLDVVEDFVIGTDKLDFRNFAGVDSRDDLKAYKTDLDGDMHFTIHVKATNERVLIDAGDNAAWNTLFVDDNFIF